jgi:RNAse (barnase) inhibitor barstar
MGQRSVTNVLLSPRPPWIYCGNLPEGLILAEGDSTSSGVRLVEMDGAEMGTEAQLHQHFIVRWKLPSYYGRNWDALHECLTDLSWLPATAYLVTISRGASVLSKEPSSLRPLLEVLGYVGEGWATPELRGFPPDNRRVPFHTLLDDAELSDERLAELLSMSGVRVPVLPIGGA